MPPADPLGIFGHTIADDGELLGNALQAIDDFLGETVYIAVLSAEEEVSTRCSKSKESAESTMGGAMPMAASPMSAVPEGLMDKASATPASDGGKGADVSPPPTIRKDFADAAHWIAALRFRSNRQGDDSVQDAGESDELACGSLVDGTRGKSGKRPNNRRHPQAFNGSFASPRFLVERDEVVLLPW